MIAASRERTSPAPCAIAVRTVIVSLVCTLATGVLVAIKSVQPALAVHRAPMQVLQPLHTLSALVLLLAGMAAGILAAVHRAGSRPNAAAAHAPIALLLFLALASISIVLGHGSGLEYVSWPLGLTALPLLALVGMAWSVWRALPSLAGLSAEGAWLLLMGAVLTPLGLTERSIGATAANHTRALMVEWHSLDTVFAGINTSLYGLAILLSSAPGHSRSLRNRWLYALAVFALLSTFGHHHYLSPQPRTIKIIAIVASMLGMVSFIRHVRRTRRALASSPEGLPDALLITASVWTTFAVGSGVLLAVPHINLIFHGTHAIVGHAMGAIIGVNVAIILAIISSAHRCANAHRGRQVLAFNVVLALIVIDLVVAGAVKGLMRTTATHRQYMPIVRDVLTPLPSLGAVLFAILARWCACAWRDAARISSDAAHGPSPPRIRSPSRFDSHARLVMQSGSTGVAARRQSAQSTDEPAAPTEARRGFPPA